MRRLQVNERVMDVASGEWGFVKQLDAGNTGLMDGEWVLVEMDKSDLLIYNANELAASADEPTGGGEL